MTLETSFRLKTTIASEFSLPSWPPWLPWRSSSYWLSSIGARWDFGDSKRTQIQYLTILNTVDFFMYRNRNRRKVLRENEKDEITILWQARLNGGYSQPGFLLFNATFALRQSSLYHWHDLYFFWDMDLRSENGINGWKFVFTFFMWHYLNILPWRANSRRNNR